MITRPGCFAPAFLIHPMTSYNHIISVELEGVSEEPVTLEEVKEFCKIDEPDDDDLLTSLIPAARALCEDYTGISFVKREVSATISNGNGYAYLPFGPCGDVESIDGKEPEITQLKGGAWKQLIWPKCNRVELVYEGGYEVLPNELKTALLNAIYFLYDNRSESGLSPTSKSILKQYRRV